LEGKWGGHPDDVREREEKKRRKEEDRLEPTKSVEEV
jgi:hypothetical protein